MSSKLFNKKSGKHQFQISYFSFLALFIVYACAQINMLTGGSKDTAAPTIDSAKTTPFNGQTNFSGQEVKIKFNEYIVLNKPADNIIITPRPEVSPTISSKNKTLKIVFSSELEENTTYTLSFNRAVADLNEKNDSIFQFVFSTGDYIDSLSIFGKVSDAFTNKASENFLIALYPVSDSIAFDSLVYSVKPTYISQTDKNGTFQINYLKEGTYYILAINDANKNLLLDKDEAVAFLEKKSILLTPEFDEQISFKSFRPLSSTTCKLTRNTFSAPGKLELIFTVQPDSFSISTSAPLLQEETGKSDSLIFWLAENPTSRMRFPITYCGKQDTLKPLYKSDNEKQKPPLRSTNNVVAGKLLPDEYLEFLFSEPITQQGIQASGIHIMTIDSVLLEPEWEIYNLRTLRILNKANQQLSIRIDSAAISSIYGNINTNNQTIVFENHPVSYFGSLIVNTDSVFTDPCIVYLLNNKGIPVDTVNYGKQMKFERLVPGEYQLRLVIDKNNDGVWTNGSLPDGRIPEKVIYFNGQVTVRSKWEMEIDWLFVSPF